MQSDPDPGCYYVDTQFGTLTYIKDIAGTLHTRIGAGGYFYVIEVEEMTKPIDIRAVGRERTEEEKRRRHLHGDKGISFSKGKQTCILGDVSGCVTTFATKDNQVAEFYMEHQENKTGITLPDELEGKRFRIRKLTPRECFRLMGVDDLDIDKMQQAGISNSGQYKLAGNSIVVDVLYHIFRRMFIDTEEPDFDGNPTQLTLF